MFPRLRDVQLNAFFVYRYIAIYLYRYIAILFCFLNDVQLNTFFLSRNVRNSFIFNELRRRDRVFAS